MLEGMAMSTQIKARIQVIFYILIVISVNYFLGRWIWRINSNMLIEIVRQQYSLVAMWLPGVIALLLIMLWREDARKIRWLSGNWRQWLEAYAFPILLTGSIAIVALITETLSWRETQVMPGLWSDIHGWFVIDGIVEDSARAWLPRMIIGSTIGFIPFFIHTLGEEIGWRGYLLPRLEQTGWKYPILIQALVWSQWHLPFLHRLPGQSNQEFIIWSIAFTLGLTALGMWIGYLYQITRSVLVATLAHASHNLFFTVWGVSLDGDANWLYQEGIPVIIGYVLIVCWHLWYKKNKPELYEVYKNFDNLIEEG